MKLLDRIFDKLNVDIKQFFTGMLVYLAYFTAIAIAMLVSGTWEFDIVLALFYGTGLIISIVFNLLNPNHKKYED